MLRSELRLLSTLCRSLKSIALVSTEKKRARAKDGKAEKEVEKEETKTKKEKQSIAVTTERLRGFTTQMRHMSISRRRRPVSTLKADILNIIYDRYSQNNNVKMATL